MAEGKGTPTSDSEQDMEPGKRPPWRKRLWGWTGFGEKKLWDWFQLLGTLAIPVVVAVAAAWFSAQQSATQTQIEEERAQDAALQAYFDQMSTRLLERDLRFSTEDDATEDSKEARILARARTLTVLGRLDPSRKTAVMQFLLEAELVQKVEGRGPIMRLSGANLSGASLYKVNLGGIYLQDTNLSHTNLGFADLSNADLHQANLENAALVNAKLSDTNLVSANLSHAKLGYADLSGASVGNANLSHADLSNADLSNADLIRVVPIGGGVLFEGGADLRHADLSNADLKGAYLQDTNLSNADLSNADLQNAYLGGAELYGAVLSDAYLRGVEGKTNARLAEQAKSLAGAIMTNGQQYEDWIKSRGDDGENSGSS